jgi:amidase
LKPWFGRLPLSGNFHNGHNGCHEILPTLGPMARSIEDLEIFMEAVLELDPLTVAFSPPFEKHDLWGKKLRIIYYTQNDVLTTSPACVRAVNMAVDVLRAQGYEVVPFEISNSFEACKSLFKWAGADGMKSYLISKEGDILEKGLSRLMAGLGLPSFTNFMIIGLLKLFSQHRAAELVGTAKEVSVQKLYECQHELLLFRKSFMDYWNASGVDFVIAPGFSFPALPHDSFSETSIAGWSTTMYNVVNFSVGTIPVTTVMKEVDILPKDYLKNDLVEDIAYQYYDPEKMHGLPVGIQVIGGYR